MVNVQYGEVDKREKTVVARAHTTGGAGEETETDDI